MANEDRLSAEDAERTISQSLETLKVVRDAAIARSFSTRSWVIAALLAINGAGALACVNQYPTALFYDVPATAFLIGVITSVLYGLAMAAGHDSQASRVGQRHLQLSIDPYKKWDTPKLGVPSNITEAISAIFGATSLLSFLIGSASLGLDMRAHKRSLERICQPIELRMLHPTVVDRHDLPQIYQALGCKP